MNLIRRRLFPLLPKGRYVRADASSLALRTNAGFGAIVSRHLRLRTNRSRGTGVVADVLAGEFEFLNKRRTLPLPIDWTLTSVAPAGHLWRFHLHYHEFLLDLLAASQETGGCEHRDRLWAIIADWITANRLDRRGALTDAWHPFCLSKRIAVWLMVWHAIAPPDELRDRFAGSLEGQIRFLERHLEWDLRGNHLLENLRTLALAGAFFEGPAAERRLDRAVKLLRLQLAEQILPSGEHFERSPMYHAQMLSALLDVRDAAAAIRPEFAAQCSDVAEQMSDFLQVMVHPDGEVALLSDTALGETPCVDDLIADVDSTRDRASGDPQARGSRQTRQPSAGEQCLTVLVRGEYWKWQHAGDCLLFDAGPVGADELPAHAHCDLLTIEASFSGKRMFVDSGVFDYADGEMRQYCRSTAAHNVLQVDGAEQCDIWSRFRMGYRGHPSSFEHGRGEEFSWCRAAHNAYRRQKVPLVGRWLACRAGGPWFCVDWAEGQGRHSRFVQNADSAPQTVRPQGTSHELTPRGGRHSRFVQNADSASQTVRPQGTSHELTPRGGRHELVTRLHLSPDVVVTPESPHAVRLDVGERLLEVRSLTDAEITLDRAWYCPDFGVRRELVVLQFRTITALPAHLGWMVHDVDQDHHAQLKAQPGGGIELQWEHGNSSLTLNPIGAISPDPASAGM